MSGEQDLTPSTVAAPESETTAPAADTQKDEAVAAGAEDAGAQSGAAEAAADTGEHDAAAAAWKEQHSTAAAAGGGTITTTYGAVTVQGTPLPDGAEIITLGGDDGPAEADVPTRFDPELEVSKEHSFSLFVP